MAVSFTQKNGEQLEIKIGRERFHTGELLFQPELWNEGESSMSLAALVMDAIMSCTPDIRETLLSNVVLVGGTSSLPGLGPRMVQELMIAAPDQLCGVVNVRVLDGDELRHTNPSSRSSTSAVLRGAEMLCEVEGRSMESWLTYEVWEDEPELLSRHYYLI
ncbi:unnamed protein product [Choristocarpus tenellus]